MRYYINQNSQISETQVSPNIVKKIYDDIVKNEAISDFYSNDTNLIGNIQLISPTYEKYVNKINEIFPNLIINGEYYILFQDNNVKNIMIQHLLSKGIGDGIGISINQAKNNLVSSLPIFANNTDIEYFNELPYFIRITDLLDSTFKGCTNLKEIDLSNITTFNGASHFNECTNLEKVILGNIRNISNNCFKNCTHLETIINDENIVTIGSCSFQNNTALSTINLQNVTSIGDNAFDGDTLLTFENLSLPNLQTLGKYAFTNTKVKQISNLGNVTFAADWTSARVFGYCNSLTSVILPNNLTIIPPEMFRDCENLETINLPESLTYIGKYAFVNCEHLVIDDINLPNLNTLSDYAFQNTLVKKITNLGNLTTINGFVFSNCKSLTYADLTSITSLEDTAFRSCTALTTVISPDLIAAKTNSFNGCSALASIDLSKCVNIGYRAFYGCVSLNNIDLSNVETIGQGAFENSNKNMNIKKNDKGYIDMTKIKSLGMGAFIGLYEKITNNYPIIDLGGNLTSIASATFKWTKANFICRNTEVPTTNSGTPFFTTYHWSENINERTGVIYVLDNMVDAFKEVWSDEALKIHPLSEIEP